MPDIGRFDLTEPFNLLRIVCGAFITEKISNRLNGKERNQEGVAGQEQVRLQLDTVLKF